jgi:hypothetical protein
MSEVNKSSRWEAQSRQWAQLFSSRRNWDSPNPSPSGECARPLWFRGTGTLAGERGGGGWESPNSDEGTYTLVLFIYTVCTLWWEGMDRYSRFVSQAHAELRGEGGGRACELWVEGGRYSLSGNFSYRAVGPPPRPHHIPNQTKPKRRISLVQKKIYTEFLF